MIITTDMTPTPLSKAITLLERAKDLLADVVCDDQGLSIECHNLSEQIEEFMISDEIDT
jgi:hypothetical protein